MQPKNSYYSSTHVRIMIKKKNISEALCEFTVKQNKKKQHILTAVKKSGKFINL